MMNVYVAPDERFSGSRGAVKVSHKMMAASLLAFGLSYGTLAQADALGLFAGIGGWHSGPSGDVSSGPESVDVEEELGFDSEFGLYGYAAFEHFIPGIPNVKVQYTEMSHSADGTLNKEFDGVNFSGDVQTELDLSHADLILYWRLLDNVANLDLGIQARKFDGEISIEQSGSANASATDIDEVLPLLYGSAGVDLPLSGLEFTLSLSGIKYEDNQLLDVTARLNYEIAIVGVDLGWRSINLQLDDVGDVDTDIRIGGPFLGISAHF